MERISDICSNVGLATLARVNPELTGGGHDYIGYLHSGQDKEFNEEYNNAHKTFFDRLNKIITEEEQNSPVERRG